MARAIPALAAVVVAAALEPDALPDAPLVDEGVAEAEELLEALT